MWCKKNWLILSPLLYDESLSTPLRLSQRMVTDIIIIPAVYHGDNLQFAMGSKKKERKQLVQPAQRPQPPQPHPNHNFVSSPFLPHFFPRHRDHHLLPCDATQLLVALPQGVGRKVKPSSKATWWKSSSWNRKAAEIRRVWIFSWIIIPGGLEKKKLVWSCNLHECNIYHICV